MKKKILSLLAALCLLATMLTVALPAAAVESDSVFDENNIIFRAPVISDIHISGDGRPSAKFFSALQQCKEYGELNAILIGGDFTEYGKTEQVEEFCDLLTSAIDLKKTTLVLSMGNHEMYNYVLEHQPFVVQNVLCEKLGEDYIKGASMADKANCRYATTINGVGVASISCMSYDEGDGVNYRQEDIDWLDGVLSASDPTMPFLITTHPMAEDTQWGSSGAYWSDTSGRMKEMLSNHPNAILFSGHLHYPINNEKSIWQGGFTAVGTSSVYYGSLPSSDPAGDRFIFFDGGHAADYLDYSQGLMAEVDAKGNTRLIRLDFHNKKTIKTPWIIPAPKADGSHLTVYTEEGRINANTAPYFANDAKATLARIPGDVPRLEVSFSKAKDNDMVMSYSVGFYDAKTGELLKRIALSSDYYRRSWDTTDKMTIRVDDRVLAPFGVYDERDILCKITAYDCDGKVTETPLISGILAGEAGAVKEKVELQPKEDWLFKSYTNFNRFGETYVPQSGVDYASYPSFGAENAQRHLAYGSSGRGNTPALVTEIVSRSAFIDVTFSQPLRGFQTDFTGAREFWMWVDFSDVSFDYCEFGFRLGNVYGTEYTTSGVGGQDAQAFLLADGSDTWEAIDFDANGRLELSGFCGFVRFDAEFFYGTSPMALTDLQAFVMRFAPADDEQIGKTFMIDQIGFAGPAVDKADGSVAMLLDGEQFDTKKLTEVSSKPQEESSKPAADKTEKENEEKMPLWVFLGVIAVLCLAGGLVAGLCGMKLKNGGRLGIKSAVKPEESAETENTAPEGEEVQEEALSADEGVNQA